MGYTQQSSCDACVWTEAERIVTQQAGSPALTSQRIEVKVKWRCGYGRESVEDCFSGAGAYEQGHHTRSSVASLPPPQHIVRPCRTAALWNSGMVREDFGASVLRVDVDGSSVGHRWRPLIILSYEIFNVRMKGRHVPNGRIYFFCASQAHLSPPIQHTPLHETSLRSWRAHALSNSHSNLHVLRRHLRFFFVRGVRSNPSHLKRYPCYHPVIFVFSQTLIRKSASLRPAELQLTSPFFLKKKKLAQHTVVQVYLCRAY